MRHHGPPSDPKDLVRKEELDALDELITGLAVAKGAQVIDLTDETGPFTTDLSGLDPAIATAAILLPATVPSELITVTVSALPDPATRGLLVVAALPVGNDPVRLKTPGGVAESVSTITPRMAVAVLAPLVDDGDTGGLHWSMATGDAASPVLNEVKGAIDYLPQYVQGVVEGLTASDVGADPEGAAADAVASPDQPGGIPYRSGKLDHWLGKITSGTGIKNVVVLGDSFGVFNGLNSYPWGLEMHLIRMSRTGQPQQSPSSPARRANGWAYAKGSSITVPDFTSSDGSSDQAGTLGGYGSQLSSGQKATNVGVIDGVSIVYRTITSGGDLIIRDGVGGTQLASIDTEGTDGELHVWTSDALSGGAVSRTIELEASGGSVRIDGMYGHLGNRTSGVRVWNCSRSGATSLDYVNTPSQGLDLIEHFADEGTLALVVLGTGTNDSNEANTTSTAALVGAIRNLTDATILGWVPFVSPSGYMRSEHDLKIAAYEDLGVLYVDGNNIMPDGQNSDIVGGDGIHPTPKSQALIARQIALTLAADPIGYMARILQEDVLASRGDIAIEGAVTATGNLTGNIVVGTAALSTGTTYWANPTTGVIAAYASALDMILGVPGNGVVWGGKRTTQKIINTNDTYTIVNEDRARVLMFYGDSPTVELPDDAGANLIGVGDQIEVLFFGTGILTFAEGEDATVAGRYHLSSGGKATLYKTATDIWAIAGEPTVLGTATEIGALEQNDLQIYFTRAEP